VITKCTVPVQTKALGPFSNEQDDATKCDLEQAKHLLLRPLPLTSGHLLGPNNRFKTLFWCCTRSPSAVRSRRSLKVRLGRGASFSNGKHSIHLNCVQI
jgi:hypothetical protein